MEKEKIKEAIRNAVDLGVEKFRIKTCEEIVLQVHFLFAENNLNLAEKSYVASQIQFKNNFDMAIKVVEEFKK